MSGFVRSFPALFLTANGLLYCVLSYLFIVDPLLWFGRLAIELQDPVGYTELKTTYIGMMSSMGLFSLAGVISSRLRFAALLLALLSYGGLAATRAWGVLLQQQDNELMMQLLVAELVSLGLAALALYCQQRSDRRPRNPYTLA